MIVSTKGRYALKAVFELAMTDIDTPMSLNTISEKTDLSELYLEQIFSVLKKKGIVKSIRGVQGGYLLTRKPDEISAGEIIKALEGELSPSKCLIDEGYCDMLDRCPTYMIWDRIKKSIDDVIDNTTLQDMIDEYNKKNL
ncbi:Rrf2 family protein [Peptoanaerobacter stomatis]|uniref:Rrf2 family protein n=1 Tax=Peptoanaerobacter stomatis TaxID=796937 RepID=J5WHL7_9FIRM|nr:Rrf2 family transcriptional regulator [Peptoanaerobacter stomatis]EHL17188.1 Rrf2 family protein [Peptoanaerobacter stomatis]EJU22017.1 transcriptional regulator [Peptoanaerobacter stomatis]NWO24839.1 Rrf2 family transcriptional regulator [Peptostreptococcaceae bacterium oral taxon 081]